MINHLTLTPQRKTQLRDNHNPSRSSREQAACSLEKQGGHGIRP